MYFSYATKYILVVDETIITINCGNASRRLRGSTYILLARNKIFPSWILVNSHVKPTSDDPVLKSYLGLWKFKATHDILEITVSWPGLVSRP